MSNSTKPPKYRWTDAKTRMAMVADRISGMPITAIAEKYGVNPSTVSRTCKRFREDAPESEWAKTAGDYRQDFKVKAVRAVEAGLDDDRDSYKRGNLGVKVMTGLGEFSTSHHDQVDIQVIRRLEILPEDFRRRFVMSGIIEDIEESSD